MRAHAYDVGWVRGCDVRTFRVWAHSKEEAAQEAAARARELWPGDEMTTHSIKNGWWFRGVERVPEVRS